MRRWNINGRAVAPARKKAILLFPHLGNSFRNPDAHNDQRYSNGERQKIHLHAVFVVVRVLAVLIFGKVVDGSIGGLGCTCRPPPAGIATWPEWDHAIVIVGRWRPFRYHFSLVRHAFHGVFASANPFPDR